MNSNDIAKLANVSRSTVSRVINNYSNVPEETRQKVQAVIDAYGYKPNASARTLAGKSNDIIGLFIADINHTNSKEDWIGINAPYNAKLVAEVIKSCKKRDYAVLVNTITDPSEYAVMEQYFQNRTIFGGVLVGFPYGDAYINQIINDGYNRVFIDQFTDEVSSQLAVKQVKCDDRNCGYKATEYLIQLGHRSILFIEGDQRLSALERKKGYTQAIADYGIQEGYTVKGLYREDIAYKETKAFLKAHQPTAIFASNDIMALGAIRAAEELGINIPQDLSIIGVDNLKVTKWQDILTTMAFSAETIADLAVQSLFQAHGTKQSHCQAQLIERSSCRKI